MKKMKQLLALATVAAMMVGMFAMTASARNDGGTDETAGSQVEDSSSASGGGTDNSSESKYVTAVPNADGKVVGLPIKKILDVGENGIVPNTTFNFLMEPVTVEAGVKDSSNATVSSGVDLGEGNGTLAMEFHSKDTVTDGKVTKQENIDLQLNAFKTLATGIYRYKVTEVEPAEDSTDRIDGMTYDATVFQVDLYIQKPAEGDSYIASVVAVDLSENGGGKVPIVFENSLSTNSVSISKVIDGDLAKQEDLDFDFYIQIPEGGDNITLKNGTHINYTISGTGIDGTESGYFVVKGDPIAKTASVESIDFPTSADGIDGTNFNHFTLKGGQTLTFTGLPEGMIFYLAEADYSGDGYGTTYDYTFGTTGLKYAASGSVDDSLKFKGTVTKGTNTITYTNKKELVPNTGINVDFAPYLLVLMVAVVGGAAVLVFKKRRTVR